MNCQFLSRTALFCGIQPEEIKTMLFCLTAETQTCEKGKMIYRADDAAASLGAVLEGADSFSERQPGTPQLHPCLCLSRKADSKSAGPFRPEKSEPVPEDFSYGFQIDPQQADGLSVGSGCQKRKQQFYHSL